MVSPHLFSAALESTPSRDRVSCSLFLSLDVLSVLEVGGVEDGGRMIFSYSFAVAMALLCSSLVG